MAVRAPIERFLEKVEVDASGCWIWTASRVADGYGQFRSGRKMMKAHRFAYEHYVGEIPDGLTLDHLCRVRACCNPQHLEAVESAVNTRRGGNAVKTHCKRGHRLEGDNIRTVGGRRICVVCNLAAQARWRNTNRDDYRAYHRKYQSERRRNEREARSAAG